MSARAADTPSSRAHSARLALIVPLAVERQCLSKAHVAQSGTVMTICQSGQGAHNAARVARAAVEQGATALMSVGVAGGLVHGVEAGDVVVPDTVIDADSGRSFECSRAWLSALHSQIGSTGNMHCGALLSVSDVLATAEQKATAATRYAALACDMESAAIASVAQEAEVHFAALRVISDAYCDELPHDVASWVDDSGNARVRPVLAAMLSPARWRSVIAMTTRFRLAQRRLRVLSQRLVASAYCCP